MPRTLTELACRLNRHRRAVPPLVLMTDPRQPDPMALAAKLPAGSMVILRHYDDPQRRDLGLRLWRLCRQRRLLFLIAGLDRLGLPADGVHLPEHAQGLRSRIPRRGMVTAACHSRATLSKVADFADAALLSPVFPTLSHPGAETLGVWRFAAWARRAGLPVYALGGVTARSIGRLRGQAGVATVGGL